MFEVDEFVAGCRAALAEPTPMLAVKEIVDSKIDWPLLFQQLDGDRHEHLPSGVFGVRFGHFRLPASCRVPMTKRTVEESERRQMDRRAEHT